MPDDYAKLELKGVYSTVSDFSTPRTKFKPASYTVRPDEYFHCEVQAALATDTVGHTTIDTSIFDSATLLVIKNKDADNYVTATFDCAGMSTTDTSVRIHAGGFFVTTDFVPNGSAKLKLIANSARVECEIFIVGT